MSSILLLCAPNTWADIIIANNKNSEYKIILPANAVPSEKYAAEELQSYLEKISGVKLPITNDAGPAISHEIILGDNLHLPKAQRSKIDFLKLGPDGFLLKTDGDRLIIAGGKPRGTLNGVYTFLEEKLGVRWFTPDLEIVPKTSRVRLPKIDETRIPALQNRDVYWREIMRNPDFAARHRVNGQHYGLTQKHGGPFTRYYPFVHSLDALVPQNLFEQHPEYFPLINGQRKSGYVQRCLSNPEVLKISMDRVHQWLKEHPEANIISVSQNDTINNCKCDQCKAIDEAEGSPAGSLLKFVNSVAESIEQDYPNVRIDTLAYQYTRKPPKTIRPRANVIVRLCSIECCFAHPLEICPSDKNQKFCADIVAWEPVAPLLYVWDYTTDFGHYQQPFPNFDSLQANVRFFVKHGVKSVFEQGNYSGGGGGEMEPLRAYILAKLLWNPDTDLQKHLHEFVNAYYSKAGPKMLDYLNAIHRPVREQGLHIHIFDRPKSSYLNAEIMNEAENILHEAEILADNDEIRFRVQTALLPVWYVKIMTNQVTDEARTNLLKQFVSIARKAGISNISESTSLADWAKKQGIE